MDYNALMAEELITVINSEISSDTAVKKYVIKKSAARDNFLIDYKSELNAAQYEAASTVHGAVLVIAGAGSGKTRTLVFRLARLIESGVNPENILLLTFTRKSAEEMLNRASALLDSRCEKVAGGTFHSFANMILRKYSNLLDLGSSFVILDRSDAEDVINLVRGQMIDPKEKRFPRKGTICSIYSMAINKTTAIEEIIKRQYPHFVHCTEKIIEICEKYNNYKRAQSLLDYDDLLLYLKTLLSSNEKVRIKLSQTYKYIMIDEYQDTNTLQADIVKLLACTHNNVMAVGDDSQSIYSFRGANFKNIMNFPNLFENTKVIKLEQNYRSTQSILDLTNEIIKNASEKYTKKLFTEKKGGEKPALVCSPNQQVESEFISQRVLELYEEGTPLNKIAVLARSARSTYNLEIELSKKNIPFRKFGGFKFIETAHIKDVIAHLRVVINREDQISWHRILLLINGIGNVACNKLLPVLTGQDTNDIKMLQVNSKSKDRLASLLELIENIKHSALSTEEITKAFVEFYHPVLADKYDDFSKRSKDLEHFIYLAGSYDTLENFLSDLALEPPDSSITDVNSGSKPDEYLTISTIHSAKGLEWDTVFLIEAVEGRFPSVFSYGSSEDLDEERRLMYVATTRAKNSLYITYPIDMFDYSTGMVLSKPSRFIEDINTNLLDKWHIVEE